MQKKKNTNGSLLTMWILIGVIIIIGVFFGILNFSEESPSKQESPTESIEVSDNELDAKEDAQEEDAQEGSVDLEIETTDNLDSTYIDKSDYSYYVIIYTSDVWSRAGEITEYIGEMGEDLEVVKSESFIERYTTTLNSLEETLDSIENLVAPEGYQHIHDNLLKFVEAYRKINKASPEDVSELKVEHIRKMVDAVKEAGEYYEKFVADSMKELEK
mgnify:CR=1 FL=1